MLNNSSSISATANLGRDAYTDLNSLNKINQLADKDQSLALKELSKQFESIFVNMMLKTMREANAVFEEGSLFTSEDMKFYRDMYDQQLALTLSAQGGVGLAESFYQQISSQYTQNQPDNLRDFKANQPLANLAIQRAANVQAEQADNTLTPAAFSMEALLSQTAQASMSEKPTANDPIAKENSVTSKLPEIQPAQMIGGESTPVKQSAFSGSPEEFVKTIYPLVQRGAAKLGINPEVLLAQSALETGWGKFVAKDSAGHSSNNLFNIKADARWKGERVTVTTLEFENNIPRKEQANFRRYNSLAESVNDYVNFLSSNPRYKEALKSTTSESFVQGLHKAGYATDPSYSAKVLELFDSKSIRETIEKFQPSLRTPRG